MPEIDKARNSSIIQRTLNGATGRAHPVRGSAWGGCPTHHWRRKCVMQVRKSKLQCNTGPKMSLARKLRNRSTHYNELVRQTSLTESLWDGRLNKLMGIV